MPRLPPAPCEDLIAFHTAVEGGSALVSMQDTSRRRPAVHSHGFISLPSKGVWIVPHTFTLWLGGCGFHVANMWVR